jgi:hypothetical protein
MANKFNTILPDFRVISLNLTFIYKMAEVLNREKHFMKRILSFVYNTTGIIPGLKLFESETAGIFK